MADEALGKEFVEFEARGLDEINLEVGKLEEGVRRAYAAQMALNQKLSDPAFRRQSAEVEKLAAANRALADTTEKISDAEKGRRGNAERDSRLRSGAYAREALALGDVRRESEKLGTLERKQRLASGLFQMDAAHASRLKKANDRLAVGERGALLDSGQFLLDARRANAGRLASNNMGLRERSTLLQSGEYLRGRGIDSANAVANARLGLQERSAALASGQYGLEARQESDLRHRAGRLENRERRERLDSGLHGRATERENSLKLEAGNLGIRERRGLLQSGEYLRGREIDSSLATAHGNLANQERGAALKSGLYAREAGHDQRLRQERELLALAERRARLGSGQFGGEARHRERLSEESRLLDRMERRTELQGKHGRLAGGMIHGLERARPGLLAAGAVGAIGVGMARSGFQGTVAGDALAREMSLLNREIAAALIPVLKDVTSAIRWVRNMFQGLSEQQQNIVGYGIAGLAGLGGLGLAANTISSAVSGLGKLFGVKTAAGSAAASIAGNVGGSVIGSAASSAIAPTVGTGTGTAAAAAGGWMARGGRLLARVPALALAAGGISDAAKDEAKGKESIYRLMRQSGQNKLYSGFRSATLGTLEMLGFDQTKEKDELRRHKERENYGTDNPHRSNLLTDGAGISRGQGVYDSDYDRVTAAVSVASVDESGPGGKLFKGGEEGAIVGKLDELIRLQKEKNDRDPMPAIRRHGEDR